MSNLFIITNYLIEIRSGYLKFVLFAFTLLVSEGEIHSQTHLKLILKTSLPIDSALIVHFTNQERYHVAFNDTLELDFKIGQTDFYHINYTYKGKIFNEKVYFNSGNITIFMKIENDKLLIEKVVGSPMFENVQNWKKQYAAVAQTNDSALLDSFLLRTYEEQIDNLFSFSIGNRYLTIHQNNKLKLYALLPLLAKQDDELKKQFGYTMLNDRLQGIIENNIITLNNFELVDLFNKTVHANASNADFVILDFWFVGCVPCMKDHKRINELLPSLKRKKVALISISNDDSFLKWKGYLEKHNYSWLQYKKSQPADNIITQLGISTYPTYILLNKEGKIMFSTYSLNEILKQLD